MVPHFTLKSDWMDDADQWDGLTYPFSKKSQLRQRVHEIMTHLSSPPELYYSTSKTTFSIDLQLNGVRVCIRLVLGEFRFCIYSAQCIHCIYCTVFHGRSQKIPNLAVDCVKLRNLRFSRIYIILYGECYKRGLPCWTDIANSAFVGTVSVTAVSVFPKNNIIPCDSLLRL